MSEKDNLVYERERREQAEDSLKRVAVCLAGALSLLRHERPRIAVASDKIFEQLLKDYQTGLEKAREALARTEDWHGS